MALEFIASCITAAAGHDPDYPPQAAALDEEAGFDKLIVGCSPGAADGLLVADEILTTTSRLGVVLEHVPGLVAPTVAARQFATLAAFHRERVGLHVVPASAAADGVPDGAGSDARSRRAVEFLDIVRMAWDAREPFDHAGEFYRVAGAAASVGHAGRGVPVYVSGEPDGAAGALAAHADVWVLDAAPHGALGRTMARVRAAAARFGRAPRFGVSLRLIAAPAEHRARDRLREIAISDRAMPSCRPLWIAPAAAGSPGGPPVVAGSYDQAAEALLGYAALGVSALVVGHDPVADAEGCAQVIARVRAAVPDSPAARPAVSGAATRPAVSGAATRPGPWSACRPSAAASPTPGWRA